ncbi:hypothetical protein KEJ18_01785 [Candidatus Bathyarchaeota archaeon]|nr:hypothetical protein [Candidatus Bathyarchaeota archaeon]
MSRKSQKAIVSLTLFLLLGPFSFNIVYAYITPILIGTDPKKDATPASVDIVKVYLTNNGTHFRFILECSTTPEPSGIRSYCVFLDTKAGGATGGTYRGADFLLMGGGLSGLYEWGAGGWRYKSSIEVNIVGNSIYLTARLSDIGYPDNCQEMIGIVAATFQPLGSLKDRAPNKGNYSVSHEVIPELPWPTPLIFVPVVAATVYYISKRRFKKNE